MTPSHPLPAAPGATPVTVPQPGEVAAAVPAPIEEDDTDADVARVLDFMRDGLGVEDLIADERINERDPNPTYWRTLYRVVCDSFESPAELREHMRGRPA